VFRQLLGWLESAADSTSGSLNMSQRTKPRRSMGQPLRNRTRPSAPRSRSTSCSESTPPAGRTRWGQAGLRRAGSTFVDW